MKNNTPRRSRRLATDKFFLQHFLPLFLAMTVIFVLFTVYTYKNSRQIMEKEFTNSDIQDLKSLSEYVDGFIMETKYMIATLMVNENLKFFYASPSPETVWENYSRQIQAQLATLRYSREAIETIYLYSEASDTIYSSASHVYTHAFEDRYWLNMLEPDENGFCIFPYAMRNSFPYVICVAKEFTVNGYRCAIAIMVDLSAIPILASINENAYQSVYLISDDNEILYRHRQNALTAPLDTVDYLENYDSNATEKAEIVSEDTEAFSFVQLHSSAYPWTYVLVTHLQNYTARLSTQQALIFAVSTALILFALLFAVIFAMRSLRPVQSIRQFLDSPEMLSSGQNSDSADIKYIAGRITQYIQSNQMLKDELQERLDILNETQILALQSQINPHFLSNTLNLMYIQATEALGYDHELPAMILNTSSLIRYAIEPTKMVPLKTELDQTDIYLAILDQRYDSDLTITHEIDETVLDAKVPRLFLQPIIENTVFHGFSDQEDTACILTIRCFRKQSADIVDEDYHGDSVVVEIQDNGIGIPEEKLEELRRTLSAEEHIPSGGKGIGLRNVVHRMNLIYSNRFTMQIESRLQEGTCFTMVFPYVE